MICTHCGRVDERMWFVDIRERTNCEPGDSDEEEGHYECVCGHVEFIEYEGELT